MPNKFVPIGKLFNLEKGELQSTKCTPGEFDFITAAEDWKTHNGYAHECEALIIAVAASGSLGRTHYVNGKFISSDLCFILTPKDEGNYPLNLAFYHFVFNSIRAVLVAATKSGTSKESINQKNLKKYELPYFDIEQQDLWIEKLKKTLVRKELLGSELTHQQTLLKKLRQKILQEAIEGKLTKEWRKKNPNVEPASELLKRIQAEKEQLIKEKKIKKQKPLLPISNEEKPFDLPDGWEYARPNELVINEAYTLGIGPFGSDLLASDYRTSGIPLIFVKNITNNNFDLIPRFVSFEKGEQLKAHKVKPGYIVITKMGDPPGTATIYQNKNNRLGILTADCIKFGINDMINSKYMLFAIMSDVVQLQLGTLSKGMGRKKLSLKRFKTVLIPLPPLAEQKAIIAKVEKLLSLCDQLETQITQNQHHAEQLMQVVLKEAFSHEDTAVEPVTAHAE